MSEKNREKFEPVYDPKDVPEGLSDEEQIRFWETHDVTEEFLAKVEEAPEEERPRPRQWTKAMVPLDDLTLERLKELAARRNVSYETLLNGFVTERLYEEERREGIISASQTKENRASAGAVREKGATKQRDWQSEAYDFVRENQSVIEDEDLDYIVSARLLKDASGLLLEISNEIKAASRKEKFPPVRLKRLMKAYNKLEQFVTKAFEVHEAKFGLPESNESRSPERNPQEEGQSTQYDHESSEMAPVTSLETFKKAKLNRDDAKRRSG
jgi:CopG antitoxin of type II toxin-antitoxin system